MIDNYEHIDWNHITHREILGFTNPPGFLRNPDLWKRLFVKQKGKCAICDRHQSELKRTLSVDHNHITKQIRGLLCRKCNLGIGLLKCDKNTKILKKAIEYIGEPNGK